MGLFCGLFNTSRTILHPGGMTSDTSYTASKIVQISLYQDVVSSVLFLFSHSQFLLFWFQVEACETGNMCGVTRPVYVWLRFTHAGMIQVDNLSNTKKAKRLEILALLGLVVSVLCRTCHSSTAHCVKSLSHVQQLLHTLSFRWFIYNIIYL